MLHLAFGLGEDWNISASTCFLKCATLHLAFGLGEDWNRNVGCTKARYKPSLHLAFGLGEET